MEFDCGHLCRLPRLFSLIGWLPFSVMYFTISCSRGFISDDSHLKNIIIYRVVENCLWPPGTHGPVYITGSLMRDNYYASSDGQIYGTAQQPVPRTRRRFGNPSAAGPVGKEVR